MAIESRGDIKYGDKGNMTKEEIDKTIAILIELKKARSVPRLLDDLRRVGEPDGLGRSGDPVHVVAGGDRGAFARHSLLSTCRSRKAIAPGRAGLGLMAHLDGLKLDAAYEYLNWYLSGWQGGFIAKQGYYSSVPETAKQFMTPDEWDYWYEGKPAKSEIKDPYGNLMEKAGQCATAAPSGSAWATSPAGTP